MLEGVNTGDVRGEDGNDIQEADVSNAFGLGQDHGEDAHRGTKPVLT